ncbi:hypothetical protein K7432_011475 [Basidiobolus ranarum]|uniref:Uncharacterized protein n=1 Tax=Basidiobolus ranarum TaxID=34480 RepID=A0ABR2VTY5_9FUNG
MKEEITDLKSEVERLKEQKVLSDQKYYDLETSFKNQENVIKELHESSRKLQVELEHKLEAQSSRYQAEADGFKKKLHAAKSLLTKQEHTINELKTAKKQSDLNAVKQPTMTIDSSIVAQLQGEIDKLEKAKRVLQDVFTEQQIEIADLKATIRNLRTSSYVLVDSNQNQTDQQPPVVPMSMKTPTSWMDSQIDSVDDVIHSESSVTDKVPPVVKPTKKRKKSTDSSTSKKVKKSSDSNIPVILEPIPTTESPTVTVDREESPTAKSPELQPRKKSSSFKQSRTTPPSQSSQDFLLLKNLPSPMSPTLPPLRKTVVQTLETTALIKQMNAQTIAAKHDSLESFKKPDSPVFQSINICDQDKGKATDDGKILDKSAQPGSFYIKTIILHFILTKMIELNLQKALKYL